MLRTLGQRRDTVEGEWAELPDELLAKVLELLQAEEGGLGSSMTSATVRLICAGWKAVYDAQVKRLVLTWQTTDEAMDMLVRRFPAVVSLEMKSVRDQTLALTDKGVHAVSSLRALTYLDLGRCKVMTCRRGAASSEQRLCTQVAQPILLLQDNGRGHASSE